LREVPKTVKNIAVTFDGIFRPSDPRIVQLVRGIARGLSQTDWHMQLYPLPDRSIFAGSHQSLLVSLLQERRIEAVLAISPHPPEDMERLQSMCLPVVSILNEYPSMGVGCVMLDVVETARQMVDYHVNLHGRHRIRIVAGPRHTHSARLVRMSTSLVHAFSYELRRRGLRFTRNSIHYSDYHWETVEPVLSRWLAEPNRPDALTLLDPELAEKAAALARDMGLRIPDDLVILGLGGSDQLRGGRVDSIVSPLEEIGMEAVAMLQRVFDGQSPSVARLPGRLWVRHPHVSKVAEPQISVSAQ
jgi:LacI family fructose operon transcriptional repressor